MPELRIAQPGIAFMEAYEQGRERKRQNEYADALRKFGPGAASGDQASLDALYALNPEQAASFESIAERRAARAGMAKKAEQDASMANFRTLGNAAGSLLKIPVEQRAATLQKWATLHPAIGEAVKAGGADLDLSDESLSAFSALVQDPKQVMEIRKQAEMERHNRAMESRQQGITPYQAETLKNAAETRAIAKQAREEAAAARKETVEQGKIDKQVSAYTNRLNADQIPQVEDMLSNVEGMLSSYEGKDIPGFGATGLVPNILISEEGQNARQSLAGLSNLILKSRSGAAVTDPEKASFLQELGSGATMSDDRLRQGIGQIRDWFNAQKRNLASGLSDASKRAYAEQGGDTRLLDFETRRTPQQPKAPQALPNTNAQGWVLHTDASGNRAYVSPDGTQYEEVQ